MSGTVSINTILPGGTVGRLAQDSAGIKAKMDRLTMQASTGLVSTTFGGLGAQSAIPLNLRPQIASIQAFSQNIDAATARLQATNSVMTQLQTITTNFLNATYNMSAQTAQAVDTTAADAKAALSQVQDLLNAKVGDTFIFAGQDTANPPMPGAAFNAYVASIQAPIANLGIAGAAATDAATLAAANATSPFSATHGTQPQTIPIGQNQSVPAGIVAGQNAFVASAGTDTTGSYVRDLVRALATMSAMNSAQTSLGATFDTFVGNIRSNLRDINTTLANETAGLGVQQQILGNAKTQQEDMKTALTAQVSGVEDADAAATATALSQAQTQLQVSYKLIAESEQLSLVQFLPTA